MSRGRQVTIVRADDTRTLADKFADSGMDRAVNEAVAWLDGDGREPFPYDAQEAVRTLEAIIAFHVSHERNAAWVDVPLMGEDRRRVLHSG